MHSLTLRPSKSQKAAAMAIVASIGAQIARVKPIPSTDWPEWALDLKTQALPGDTGIGDTAVHIIGDTRSQSFKNWFLTNLGTSCGCTERQRWLNMRYPYLKSTGTPTSETTAAAPLQP